MSANLTRIQLDAIVHALAVALPARSPADAVLKHFFRDHKALGSRDRALVADTVYSVLRRRRLLEALTPSAAPRELALASLVKLQGYGIGSLEPVLRGAER
ncbi:MAG TPA: SAM-dependent methyltransferase, partial [Usitatibacteraceae bacterium]|nr:SAM-dependent methyltransferase [Usitatibacteraceae bacterium]